MPAPIAPNEVERLIALHSCQILDTAQDPWFERIVQVTALSFDVPICLVSLIDSTRQWFKAKVGLDASETPRDFAFCAYTILGDAPFVVEDATRDGRFYDNPLVTGPPDIRFYAGVPLLAQSGAKLGSLCIIDRKPRSLDGPRLQLLKATAAMVAEAIAVRKQLAEAAESASKARSAAKERALLMSVISHELRTPLNHIIGFSGMIEDELFGPIGNDKYREYGKIIRESSQHLSALVDGALQFGKAAYGTDINRESVDLNQEIGHVVRTFEVAVTGKKQRLDFRNGEQVVQVYADRRALRQILTNLISNASNHCPDRTTISLEAREDHESGRGLLIVSDDGPGISEEVIASLGQPFNSGKISKDSSGLGLRICDQLAKAMGADFAIKSSPQGSSTSLALPLTVSAIHSIKVGRRAPKQHRLRSV
jgi:signal transduction histidine kinase